MHTNPSGILISLIVSVCNLGMLLDPDLLLGGHVAAIAQSASYQLRLVCQLHIFLDKKVLVSATHTVVTCQLNLLQQVLHGTSLGDVTKTTSGPNTVACLLTGEASFHYVTPLLRVLHWQLIFSMPN